MAFFRILWTSITIAFFLILYSLFISPKGLKEYIERRNLYTELSRRHQELMTANRELYDRIKKFSQSAEFREQVIREKLGWTGPGEKIIVITSEKENPPGRIGEGRK
ncbi:FtsB family cell division protein [Thermodesulforhabdus norvegica]|uniref:Septum formation initiator n=1 Tax=Thermodesulforhabdus norvegica TaxID=39841 RepID=A0A1I4VXU6_9BACT|nr:septum formation initiator family protein [Thermodesulforhabdus norvegica]SFN06035.1 Septum formation initiator [Thermodesulforhabdus norvegica]